MPFSLHGKAEVEVLCYAEDIDQHFKNETFDAVLCTEVLEHTVDDRKVINNIYNVLKSNGVLIISVPFTYVMHEAPHDYRRYTYYGIRDILEKNGFEIKSVLSGINKNKFVNALSSVPELIFYKTCIPFFRKKLNRNEFPSVNEIYSSMGYFLIAVKSK